MQRWSRARRPCVPVAELTEQRSAADAVGGSERTRSGAEQRARSTAIAIRAAAQNGTSGVLVDGKHARRRAPWGTPRTGSGAVWKSQSERYLCGEIGFVKTVRGPQYGNLSLMIVVMVLPIALIFGLASAFAGWSVSAPVGGSVGMLVLAVIIHRRSVVLVDTEGITLLMFAAQSVLIPWSDIQVMEHRPLSLRVVRRATQKRAFVQILCPHPLERPVGRAIRAHLATAEHEQSD